MSKIIDLKINLKDTVFILRLIHTSPINGAEIEQAYDTMNKFKEYHKRLLSRGVDLNG